MNKAICAAMHGLVCCQALVVKSSFTSVTFCVLLRNMDLKTCMFGLFKTVLNVLLRGNLRNEVEQLQPWAMVCTVCSKCISAWYFLK